MEELIYIKEAPNRGSGVFAARDISKDEIIAEFNLEIFPYLLTIIHE